MLAVSTAQSGREITTISFNFSPMKLIHKKSEKKITTQNICVYISAWSEVEFCSVIALVNPTSLLCLNNPKVEVFAVAVARVIGSSR